MFLIEGGIGCLVLSSTITMSVPYGLGKILDMIYSSDNSESNMAILDQFCLALCGIFIIGGLANFGRVYLFNNACKFKV